MEIMQTKIFFIHFFH